MAASKPPSASPSPAWACICGSSGGGKARQAHRQHQRTDATQQHLPGLERDGCGACIRHGRGAYAKPLGELPCGLANAECRPHGLGMTQILIAVAVLLATGAGAFWLASAPGGGTANACTWRPTLPRPMAPLLRRQVPLFRRLPADLQLRLKGLMQVFLAEKPIIGRRGLVVTDEMRITIAALACLLRWRGARRLPRAASGAALPSSFGWNAPSPAPAAWCTKARACWPARVVPRPGAAGLGRSAAQRRTSGRRPQRRDPRICPSARSGRWPRQRRPATGQPRRIRRVVAGDADRVRPPAAAFTTWRAGPHRPLCGHQPGGSSLPW